MRDPASWGAGRESRRASAGRACARARRAVDNVTVSAAGDVLVCEDGGNLEIGIISTDRFVAPLLRFTGPQHAVSELCGVVFDPASTRLYVTSQRAEIVPGSPLGAIYEISGPFRVPAGGVPADLVYGPPLGEPAPGAPPSPAPPSPAPPAPPPPPATVTPPTRPVSVVLARLTRQHPGSKREVAFRLKLARTQRVQLGRARGTVKARVLVTARDAAGNDRTVVKTVTIGRAT